MGLGVEMAITIMQFSIQFQFFVGFEHGRPFDWLVVLPISFVTTLDASS
jgi:hypothetical protein